MKVAVMSNKGGVGKTTISIALAYELARRGYKIALVDLDFHGPTLPIIAGINKAQIEVTPDCIKPAKIHDNIEAISIQFMKREDDDPVLWPGDVKRDMVIQIVEGRSVCWNNYDIMVVDSPPSLGDENLTLLALIDKVVLVTTPHPASVHDIRSMIKALQKVGKPLTALVVNMADLFEGEIPKVDAPVIKIPFDKEFQKNPTKEYKPIKSLADIIISG